MQRLRTDSMNFSIVSKKVKTLRPYVFRMTILKKTMDLRKEFPNEIK